MTEAVTVAIIMSAPTTAAVLLSAWQQRKTTRETVKELKAGQQGIHDLVDGKSSEQLEEIKALKKELARVSRSDEAHTPTAAEGGPVTMDHGVVTTEKRGRRQGEQNQ